MTMRRHILINLKSMKTFVYLFVAISYLSFAVSAFADNADGNGASPQEAQTVEKFGVTFLLQGCRVVEKKPNCRVTITSHNFDKRLALTTSQQKLIDNTGKEYSGVSLQIGDQESASWLNSVLKADLPTNGVIYFQNLSTKADSIDLFEIVGSLAKHGKSNYIKISFSDIPFSR